MRDVASDALVAIHRELRIDEEWTVWGEGRFSWLGFRLRQDFNVSSPISSSGIVIHRVWSTILVLTDIVAHADRVAAVLGELNRQSIGESFVWDPAARSVVCHVGAPVHAETLAWRPAQIAHIAILALRVCEDRADQLASLLEGTVATWQHPKQGNREIPDEMLWIGERVFAPAGQSESNFAVADDFRTICENIEDTPFFSAGSTADGLSIEVPFGTTDTTLIQLQSQVKHPALGVGLLTTVKARIPEFVNLSAASLASSLNNLELSGSLLSANFGAWCVDRIGEQEIIAHAWFTPSLMYKPHRSEDIANISMNRAIWLAETLLGEDAGRVQEFAHEIVLNRHLHESPSESRIEVPNNESYDGVVAGPAAVDALLSPMTKAAELLESQASVDNVGSEPRDTTRVTIVGYIDREGAERTIEIPGWNDILQQLADTDLDFAALQGQMYVERPYRDLRDLPEDLTVVDLRHVTRGARMVQEFAGQFQSEHEMREAVERRLGADVLEWKIVGKHSMRRQ